jgi:hypothetical protein
MKTPKAYPTAVLIIVFLCLWPALSFAQVDCEATTLEEFFDCYGGTTAFSDHSVAAVTAFIQAEDAIKAGDYASAKRFVEAVFETYPKGNSIWWSVTGDVEGANIGSPHAYYGLRMIEDIVDHHLNNPQDVEAKKAKMKIVLVGCSEGIQPTNFTELAAGGGPFVENSLEPKLVADDYRIVKQSFEFMSRYVTAITGGELEIEVEIVELPDVCLDVNVSTESPLVASGSIQPVWEAFSDEVKDDTDWWWILYPSHVPDFSAFDNSAFITGGMGLSQRGGPTFIIDDKWLSRKPPHIGTGNYSDIERRIYLPQWLQHEFFHHLYRAYPELELEVSGHDWFNRSFWPADFEGQFETDYYAETLHKRLQTDCVPLAVKLITRAGDQEIQQIGKLSIDELLGAYSLNNVQNDWHKGRILKQGSRYFWRNDASVQWEVTPNFAEGRLETGSDCPYPGQDFFLELFRTAEGDYVPGALALKFGGDLYQKRFNLLRGSVPIEIALGEYERMPNEATRHTGRIVKEAGLLFWENDAGDRWSLTPNTEAESFSLNDDSPTTEQDFQLIIIEDACGRSVLGFKYLGYYYWKPKRDPSNESPTLINPLADLELEADFNTHLVDAAGVFSDPEDDPLLLFATSSESTLVSTNIVGQKLTLSGSETGSVSILVTAVDANGGLVTDEFNVVVGDVTPTRNHGARDSAISIFPNPAKDHFFVSGPLSEYDMSIFSVDGSLQRAYKLSGQEQRIDLSAFSSGAYLIRMTHSSSGRVTIKKIVKD